MSYVSLPEKFHNEKFDRVISEFIRILGHEHVYTDEKKMRRFASFLISANIEDHMPSAAIFPERAEQVIEIVKICDKYKVPLWVSSTGRNIGYGAMAPCKKGAVILSLKRMRRIIEINEDLCYAFVEPGVTYKQLYDNIKENDYKLWLNIPTGPTPIAGPVGTSIDRGTGYTPYGDNFEYVCGMEIPFNKKSAKSVKKSIECYLALIRVFAQNGYGLYRTNIAFMDAVGETYGPTIQNVFRKIKLALDPNGIVSPGKAGIVL